MFCNLSVTCAPRKTFGKEVNNRGYHFAFMKNPDACIGCAACATVCPDGCIEVYRVKVPD